MPGGDRTGPKGEGARQGRGMGFCNGYDVPGSMNPGGAGVGQGWGGGGRGRGRARGAAWGRGRGWGAPGPVGPDGSLAQDVRAPGPQAREGDDGLRARVEELGRMMDDLRRRLDEGHD